MGTILVVAEIQKGAIREASYELVALARGLAESGGHEVNGLVIGSGVGYRYDPSETAVIIRAVFECVPMFQETLEALVTSPLQ